jgi:hypothetical protein
MGVPHILSPERHAESPFLRLLERKSGLIGFIAPDVNVHVIDQAGGGAKALTDDAAFWSWR